MSDPDELPFRLSPRALIVLDLLFAAAYTALLLVIAVFSPSTANASIPIEARALLVLAIGVPVAVRRRWPVAVVLVTGVAATLGVLLGVTSDGFVGTALALYVVAARGDQVPHALTRGSLVVGIGGVLLLVLAGSPLPQGAGFDSVLVPVVLLTGAWATGRAVAERRRYVERTATERVERALTDERLRIARDLHDVVAHGLGLMVVTASTANHVLDERPDEARAALRTIESTGRAALTEMRHLLGVLRTDATDAAALAPAPGIGDLTALSERITAAGVPVRLEVGAIGDVPDGVSVVVFRIVQEALTNVVRHADATSCIVRVGRAGDVLEVEVADDGRRRSPVGEAGAVGHGLVGMRERVRMLGGELDAGPMPGRGFHVLARIPRTAGAAASSA